MSHRRKDSASSTCAVFTCTSEEFWDFYDNDKLSTVELSHYVLVNVVHPRSAHLRPSDTRYRLDDLPVVLAIARAIRTEPTSSQTPPIDDTVQPIGGADRSQHAKLRDLREQHRCASTGAFDLSFVTELTDQDREQEIPDVPQRRMEAAHVIRFLLNDFKDNPSVRCTVTVSFL
ncbi:hypothetical protein K438DRAFT_1983014 [Mycena galopus ATCC 62051]|nr:hypothetical protein K438DRAFT_1983014 [Mycena galopus ATCC 62051]